MDEMKIQRYKPLEKWVAVDFVRYFYTKCEEIYGKDKFEKNWDKDCMIMKTILVFLKSHSKTHQDILSFIDWAYARYQQKTELVLTMQIGILKSWIRDYFQIPYVKRASKKKREAIKLSSEAISWIEKEKLRLAKKGKGPYVDR